MTKQFIPTLSPACYHGKHDLCALPERCACDCHQPEPKPPSDDAPGARTQEPPIKNTHPFIQDLVLTDIEARKEIGIQRYGTLLQPFNGRDFLLDAYQECLDQVLYLRGCLYERDGR